MTTVTLLPRFARRLPDPSFNNSHGAEHHIFYVAARELPSGISLEPSPRNPKTRWDVYREAQSSLLNLNCTPGAFHLKNKGITILAKEVRKIDEEEYEIVLGPGHGIVDGSHTYRLICEARRDPNLEVPEQQYVRVEVVTRIPDEWHQEVSAGLNKSITSQADGLDGLKNALGWLRDELESEDYFKAIAWSESDRAACDIRDILSAITCFNTASYPNAGSTHPVVTYDNKPVVLSSFEEDFKAHGGRAYLRLRPIVRDILRLHDTIQLEFPKLYEQTADAAPELIERASKKPFEFIFLRTFSTERLAKGALLPILAAFRWMVEDDPAQEALSWRGGFDSVLKRWRDTGQRLVAQTIDKSRECGRNPDAIGKSASHWSALHKEVAFVDLMAQRTGSAAAP